MFSSQKNMEAFQLFFAEIKKYFTLQKKYFTLEATEKVTVLFSALAIGAILFVLGTIVIIFLCAAFALYLGDLWNSMPLGMGFVALLLLIIFIIVYLFRKQIILAPIARLFANLFLNEDNSAE